MQTRLRPTVTSALESSMPEGTAREARTDLSAAIELYRAMQMTFWLPQAEAALGQAEGW